MKKSLLFACLALSTTTFAQFNDMNSPQIGNGATMYVLDTFVTNYPTTTGTGVTWDYSSALGVSNTTTKSVAVLDATTHADASLYTGAEIAIEIPGFMTAFNVSTSGGYSSKGFIFSEGTNTYKAKFNSDDEALMAYPGDVPNTSVDAIAGEVETPLGPFPCTGTANTAIDGSGTLILNSTTTLTGVRRFKIVDSLYVDAGVFGNAVLKRTQYEYYHHATSYLPVFVHSTLDLTVLGAQTITGLVLSAYAPDGYMSVASNELTGVSVYPNPATDVLNINGLTEDASIEIYALNGQLIKTIELALGTSAISVEELNAGTYIVKATTANGTLTSKITVK